MPNDILTSKEAASYLRVSMITLAKWRGAKKGPTYTRTGRSIKYRRRDLDAYLKKNAVTN